MSTRRWLVALALVAACVLVYAQTFYYGFLNFDDNSYIFDNQQVRQGITAAGLRWAFTTIDYFYWQPLTWLSHMVDCQIFGLRPGWHHLVSLMFHVVNVLLVLAVLLRLTGAFWKSAAVAALFALHPLRIESVAWAAERKDVLSGLFFLLAIWCYLGYVRLPSKLRYYGVCGMFTLGLLAKPMVMTLPVILLVLDWWPLGRRAFAEKLPMFALAAVSSVITSIGTARLGSVNWGGTLSLGQRISNGLISYGSYLELTFWPHDLAILYPFRLSVPLWQSAGALLLLASITGLALWQARQRPYLITGWLWFAIGMLPAMGLMQVGWQSMADRFTYLPHIGLAIAVVWGMGELLDGHERLAAALAVSVAAVLAFVSWRHLPAWRDSETAFRQTLAVTGANPAARHYLAAALDEQGRFDEAFAHHAEAVRLKPDYAVARYAYGLALERRGQPEAAIQQFQEALLRYPNDPDLRRHLEINQKLLHR